MTNTTSEAEELLRRVKSEFTEMPGLRLTQAQAARLLGLDNTSCASLLNELVDTRFLFRTRDGFFMRLEHAVVVRMSRSEHSTAAVG